MGGGPLGVESLLLEAESGVGVAVGSCGGTGAVPVAVPVVGCVL
jgi:hypothetical protein